MDLDIYPARPADIEALMALDEKIYPPGDWFEREECEKFSWFWIAKDGLRIGSLALGINMDFWGRDRELPPYRLNSLSLNSISLIPELQRQGLGSTVMNWIIDFAREHGFERIVSNYRKSNEASARLHAKLEFKKINEVASFYRDPDEATIVVELTLTNPA